MMYSSMPAANGRIKYYCNSERYPALAMKNPSLTEGYQVQPYFMAAKGKRARDPAV